MADIVPIAHAENVFTTKFGIPRQGGLARVETRIVFEVPFRSYESLRGLDTFSHLWLIWQFSEVPEGTFRPMVRPPRLGGNKRMGVFATRSPFRPNRLGLSVVRLLRIESSKEHGMVLVVEGADLMNGTPIFDIKPYLPFVDAIPTALAPFTDTHADYHKHVVCPNDLLNRLPDPLQKGLVDILSEDPRPQYQIDDKRVYYLTYDRFEVTFRATDTDIIVLNIQNLA